MALHTFPSLTLCVPFILHFWALQLKSNAKKDVFSHQHTIYLLFIKKIEITQKVKQVKRYKCYLRIFSDSSKALWKT